jgi:hypothetical protein
LLPIFSISLRWRGFCKTKASIPHFLSVPFGSQNPSTVFCRDRFGVAAYQVGHAGALEDFAGVKGDRFE